eukprot:GHVP01040738.1.p2 GENE.GHVP01040738.1~~GHVP01040738.1.p2  ORF type:complete len:143 (+),score=24.04 GHVP01040738.1:925-1353(+)
MNILSMIKTVPALLKSVFTTDKSICLLEWDVIKDSSFLIQDIQIYNEDDNVKIYMQGDLKDEIKEGVLDIKIYNQDGDELIYIKKDLCNDLFINNGIKCPIPKGNYILSIKEKINKYIPVGQYSVQLSYSDSFLIVLRVSYG